MTNNIFCGNILIVGRINVGKSSILNKLINKNISIVSRKSNTTIENIIGIYTKELKQCILIDSPGLNLNKKIGYKNLNSIIKEIHIIIIVTEALKWTNQEEKLIFYLKKNNIQYYIVINKIDLIKDKKKILPHINKIKKKNGNKEIFLISAKKNIYIDNLRNFLLNNIPKNKHKFSKNKYTNCKLEFLISESIREQLLNNLHQEIPYIISVKIETFLKMKNDIYQIKGVIFVKNLQQKKIIIGKNGKKIKMISIKSRYSIEKKFSIKVNLFLWIKMKEKK